jgi:hypothetical protein
VLIRAALDCVESMILSAEFCLALSRDEHS